MRPFPDHSGILRLNKQVGYFSPLYNLLFVPHIIGLLTLLFWFWFLFRHSLYTVLRSGKQSSTFPVVAAHLESHSHSNCWELNNVNSNGFGAWQGLWQTHRKQFSQSMWCKGGSCYHRYSVKDGMSRDGWWSGENFSMVNFSLPQLSYKVLVHHSLYSPHYLGWD